MTQVVDGEMKEFHLCEEHAQKQGLDFDSPMSITDMLMGFGQQAKQSVARDLTLACPSCGMARDEFSKSGRLGCPDCYKTFMAELAAAIKGMHHSSQHTGKIPGREGTKTRTKSKIARWQKDLNTAVAREDYEQAAKIRDEIKAFKETESSKGGAS